MTDIVVDTSAAVAIVLSEPELDELLATLDAADTKVMSAATLVELAIVLEARLGPGGHGIADRFVRDGGVDVVAFDEVQAHHALEGWRRFGRGRHPAALNLGDCFTYGLAIASGADVLCVGTDFARTDVPVVPLR